MTLGERIKKVCKDKRIPVAKLERDLGFANAYIAGLKDSIPYDRLIKIAKYLNVSAEYLFSGEESKSKTLCDDELELLAAFNRLNLTGRAEALRRIIEMTELTSYSKDLRSLGIGGK